MWKANIGMTAAPATGDDNDDDWETDPDFVNDVSEQEQRWGSKTVDGSGRTVAAVDMSKLREEVTQSDNLAKKKQMEEMPNAAYGGGSAGDLIGACSTWNGSLSSPSLGPSGHNKAFYGGKFGVQKDRMDQSAVGHDYIGKVEKHASQKDHSAGFGGKFGIQTDRVDKSAVSWDHKEKVEKHTSQKDYSTGFGGKFGVQTDRVDSSAVGWDHMEKASKHESQKDYTVGFGGKFGVQTDRQDKSAMGWDHHESVQKHESQTDHKKGFGGKFGVQTDRVDKSAVGFDEPHEKIGTAYTKFKPDIGGVKPSSLRAKFENMAKENEEIALKKAKDEREKRFKEEQKERDDDRSRNKNFNAGVEDKDRPRPGVKSAINTGRESSIQSNVKLFSPHKTADQQKQGPPKMIEIEKSSPALQPIVSSPVEENGKQPDIVQGTHKADIIEETEPEPIAKEIKSAVPIAVESPVTDNEDSSDFDGYIAVALYDYQAAAPDEISFDPDDVISHIEMIDEGWWRGLCKDQYGLFPANYVQLQEK